LLQEYRAEMENLKTLMKAENLKAETAGKKNKKKQDQNGKTLAFTTLK